MTRNRTFVAALLVFAFLGGGCGGDDDDVQALSKDDFLEQANAVCTAGQEKLDERFNQAFASGEPTPDEVEALMDDVAVPAIRGMVDDIRALGAPDEIDGGVDSFLDAAAARLDEIDAMDADEVFAAMTSGEDPFAEVNAMATQIGLTACADDGGEALTEAEFLEQGNAICSEGGAELDAAADAAFAEGEPDAESMKAFIDDIALPGIRAQVDAIDALAVPDSLHDQVGALLTAAYARLDEISAMDGDELLALFTSGEDPFAEVNEQSTAVGLTACAEG